MHFVRDRQVLVEIQKSHHCAKRLLELRGFLLESSYAQLGQVAPRAFEHDTLLGLLHIINAFLHLPLNYDESFLQEHDIVIIWRIGVLPNLLDANPTKRLVLGDAQVLYFLLMNLT